MVKKTSRIKPEQRPGILKDPDVLVKDVPQTVVVDALATYFIHEIKETNDCGASAVYNEAKKEFVLTLDTIPPEVLDEAKKLSQITPTAGPFTVIMEMHPPTLEVVSPIVGNLYQIFGKDAMILSCTSRNEKHKPEIHILNKSPLECIRALRTEDIKGYRMIQHYIEKKMKAASQREV